MSFAEVSYCQNRQWMRRLAKVSIKLAHADLHQRIRLERAAGFRHSTEAAAVAQPAAHRSEKLLGGRFQKSRIRIAHIGEFPDAIDKGTVIEWRGDLQLANAQHMAVDNGIRAKNCRRTKGEGLLGQSRSGNATCQTANASDQEKQDDVYGPLKMKMRGFHSFRGK